MKPSGDEDEEKVKFFHSHCFDKLKIRDMCDIYAAKNAKQNLQNERMSRMDDAGDQWVKKVIEL